MLRRRISAVGTSVQTAVIFLMTFFTIHNCLLLSLYPLFITYPKAFIKGIFLIFPDNRRTKFLTFVKPFREFQNVIFIELKPLRKYILSI
ncbi:hypothetical protein CHK_0008 [Christensenella hongkongensis]|uniref:Uncharacterized protein n=1 Tax=Christensenella hongkongensis TaxID=270498 RepID=A0A0M2NIW3_9FIRM|nr:hypothetical protein CHK_0008 [Christensenella hongkongensis]